MHIFPQARSLNVLSKRVVFELTINNFLEHKNVHIPNMLQQYLRQVVEGMVVVYVGEVEGRVVWGRRLEGALTPTGTSDTALHGDMGVPSPVKPLHIQMV